MCQCKIYTAFDVPLNDTKTTNTCMMNTASCAALQCMYIIVLGNQGE